MRKGLLMFAFLCSLFGCNEEPDPLKDMYNRGEIMKFYGTDVKCTIVYRLRNGYEYNVRYIDSIGVVHDKIVGHKEIFPVETAEKE